VTRKPTIISLYTGAGGLDYGFEAAGFKTRAAVEMDSDCCKTLRANRRWAVLESSIHDVSTTELLSAAKLEPGDADMLIGGPPCQPFSKSGYWARGDSLRLDDPRAETLGAYMRVVEEAQPRAFLLENVEGMSYSGKAEGVELLLEFVRQINARTGSKYRPTFRVLNAADYGVPQLRNRFFMIASRDGAEFEFPAPVYRPESDDPQLSLDERPTYRTAWHAIGDVQPGEDEDLDVRGKWAELLPSIPEGNNYLWHTDRGGGLPLFGWRRRYWSFLLKLAKDRPSWTIQAQPGPAVGPFHWRSRRLSMRELCRLQTFPNDVVIHGDRNAIHRQVGNAVPSLLAETLAREIAIQLLGRQRRKTTPKLLSPNEGPMPAPEHVAAVAKQYRHLAGEHESHPGTGKGYGAVARLSNSAEDASHRWRRT
jgi:DNA (cytosine-5)-methyltransferase 1